MNPCEEASALSAPVEPEVSFSPELEFSLLFSSESDFCSEVSLSLFFSESSFSDFLPVSPEIEDSAV